MTEPDNPTRFDLKSRPFPVRNHDQNSSGRSELVAAATLAALPDITPHRLRRLFERFGDAKSALMAVSRGEAAAALRAGDAGAADLARRWQRGADPVRVATEMDRRGTHVWVEGADGFPITKPAANPPCVLLGEGVAGDVFDRPRVAIVGTRSATPHGLADAAELGGFLALAGVTVVSGMAIGIDGAAHEGALAASGAVVGVVATGLDIEYPRRHAPLYRRVRKNGVVVSEHWYGVPPDRGRFPVSNRIIAALSDVVVIVEATLKGGARHTADAALDYGRPVLAIPGSRRNAAAAGCNQLISDGAGPLLEPSDVLVALELAAGGRAKWKAPRAAERSRDERAVLRSLGGEPATVDDIMVRTGLATSTVINALRSLERDQGVRRQRGFIWPS
ncbi:MAG: protecting protein DprA [Actinomycetia bacterium]|nr:protecting protein DprA [Actinomycetes bacterium]